MATAIDCIANAKTTCVYCERGLKPGQPMFGLTLFIQNDAGFDTMVIRRFCSFACKTRYRERIEREIQQSPRFRLGEFETTFRREKR